MCNRETRFNRQFDSINIETQPKKEDEHSHEIPQHNVLNTGFPILPSDPPTPCFPFNPPTVPNRRGRVDMKALICWLLCSELLCLHACLSCSPAHPHACGCSRPYLSNSTRQATFGADFTVELI